MMTKTLVVLAFIAGMLTAHALTPAPLAPVAQDEIQIDCEYEVTPRGATLVKGAETC